MGDIITIENLSMVYQTKIRKGFFKSELKKVHALTNINLKIREGSIFGILGPNGAGKTTLIKCLTTLLIPTFGSALVNGYDITDDEKQVRASIGAMLMGERGLYWKLTARENLLYFAQLYSIPNEMRGQRVDELIELLDLGDFADRPVESYSSGQRMKVAFAKALVHDPPIIFLDEPTIAMDVQGARKLKEIVKSLPKLGKTVIYTTHIMGEAEELCDQIAIIDKGEIIACDTPSAIKKLSKGKKSIQISGIIPDTVIDILLKIDGIQEAKFLEESKEQSQLNIIVSDTKKTLSKITEVLVNNHAQIEYIRQSEPTLEDVFIELTGRTFSQQTPEKEN